MRQIPYRSQHHRSGPAACECSMQSGVLCRTQTHRHIADAQNGLSVGERGDRNEPGRFRRSAHLPAHARCCRSSAAGRSLGWLLWLDRRRIGLFGRLEVSRGRNRIGGPHNHRHESRSMECLECGFHAAVDRHRRRSEIPLRFVHRGEVHAHDGSAEPLLLLLGCFVLRAERADHGRCLFGKCRRCEQSDLMEAAHVRRPPACEPGRSLHRSAQ